MTKIATHLRRFALAAILAGSTYSSHAAATIYFTEDFESGLGQWNPGSSFITAGNGGNVLTFGALGSGGDAATSSTEIPLAPSETLYISFDYAGEGGFLGFTPGSDHWLAGNNYVGDRGPVLNLDYSGVWKHYEVIVAGTDSALPAQIILEDFLGSTSGGTQDAFFDNIVVANYSGASIPSGVPDGGSSVLLMTLGIGALAAFRRARK